MKNDIEKRSFNVEYRQVEGDKRTVAGYAALYNSETQLRPGIFERIAPGAFKNAISVSDIRALLNHDPNHILGRVKSGTLRVWEDDKGLAFECDLPESREDVMESLKRGDVDQCSFAFTITEDGFDTEKRSDGSRLITITKIDRVYDVTIATYPAYEDTVVSARCAGILKKIEEETKQVNRRNENLLRLAQASII